MASPSVGIGDPDSIRRDGLAEFLTRHGLQIEAAASFEEAHAISRTVDLLLIEASLPGGDPLQFCRRQAANAGPPVIILAAPETDPAECILALELGAADYIAHDRPRRELLARIRSALRTRPRARDGGREYGRLFIDPGRRQVLGPDGKTVGLTPAETDLLLFFLERPGQMVTRQDLLAFHGGAADQNARTMDVQVSRLRRKLAAADPGADPIRTVYGGGYRFGE